MALTKQQLDAIRGMAEEFRRLTKHGNFSDFPTVERYSQLSAKLSCVAIPLLDEIDRLRAGAPAEPERETVVIDGKTYVEPEGNTNADWLKLARHRERVLKMDRTRGDA